MKNNLGRIARTVLAPRAVIIGVSAFQFGLSLSELMGPAEEYFNHREAFFELFLAFTVLAASACLAAKRVSGNLLAAFLCGPLPLFHALVFSDTLRCAEALPLSGAHVSLWARELARLPTNIWLLSVVSFAILAFAIAATLRPSPKP